MRMRGAAFLAFYLLFVAAESGVGIMKDITCSLFTFEDLIQGNFLYVDKTEYIWNMIRHAQGMYFMARPRRFGKSLTLSTLKAVFEGKKELFKGLAIYDKPYDWKPYPVIHLDMSGQDVGTLEKVEDSFCNMLRAQARVHGVTLRETSSNPMFHELIDALHDKAGKVVILLDEYDKPILNHICQEESGDYLQALKFFYSVIKAKTGQLRFVLITGVSKFCHVSLFSELNNLLDISMDVDYATMMGYTQEELEAFFGEHINCVGGRGGVEATRTKIREWYNGYRFHKDGKTVYNPASLAMFFVNHGEYRNYWFSTGTPSFLVELMKQRDFDIEAALKESVPEVAFSAFEIDNIDPLALLLQTGYLTIKGTEENYGKTWYFLDFPNKEVADSFSSYILNSYANKTESGVVMFTRSMANALSKGDLKALRKNMEVFFAGIPYTVHKKNEATFQAIFFALFRLLGHYIEAESATNDGRIDAVVQTDKAIYLFEFKLDNDATALEQIKAKDYFRKYLLDKRSITIVGVNFDSLKGNLVGWQEETIVR